MKSALIAIFITFTGSTSISQDTTSLFVSGNCEMCKNRIELITNNIIGVHYSSYNIDSQRLNIVFDSILFQKKEVIEAILMAGHDIEGYQAPNDVYNLLPSCCLYRKLKQANSADSILNGVIFEQKGKSKHAIIGANVYWENSHLGTTTNEIGKFTIPMPTSHKQKLIVSYMGFSPDTFHIAKSGFIEIVLKESIVSLDEVNVKHRKRTAQISYLNTIKVKNISQKEFQKAACCNLSESFSTNPSIDVSFTDAITGTKQIEMLGLAGPYVQITRENMPDIRGFSSIFGFTYIPGPWIESMQMNLGSGSVLNGFESIAGQINVELKKPGDSEPLFVNGYYSQGRLEGNVVAHANLGQKWNGNILLHYNTRYNIHDRNNDGFLDMPTGNSYITSGNFHFFGDNGNEGQFGFKITNLDQMSGQSHKMHNETDPNHKLWQANLHSNRYEVFLKRGKVFQNKKNTSLGFQFSGLFHNQKSIYGLRNYDATQKMIYTNLLYQTILKSENHKITFGASAIYDNYDENVSNTVYKRTEITTGAFGEFSFSKFETFDLVLGMRLDHHNIYGFKFTPRIHSKYAINEFTVLRGSIGKGWRTANIFVENIGLFASSRKIQIKVDNENNPYGLNPESAWNFGINFTRDFLKIMDGLTWEVDLYHTKFNNQIIADMDSDAQTISFYNLNGKSYSTSIQTQIDFTPMDKFDIRLAYRYNDVKSKIGNKLLRKSLASPHRAFINFACEFSNSWKLDYTVNWQSSKRIPSTFTNPEEYRFKNKSPNSIFHDLQLTKTFQKNKYELYLGIENIFNFTQQNAILSAEKPFSDFFDSSLAWGPIFGRNFYCGFRYKIFKKDR
jgi:outer membrane receptor for ferrienterochelin and colicin/copper chaperone CopZ